VRVPLEDVEPLRKFALKDVVWRRHEVCAIPGTEAGIAATHGVGPFLDELDSNPQVHFDHAALLRRAIRLFKRRTLTPPGTSHRFGNWRYPTSFKFMLSWLITYFSMPFESVSDTGQVPGPPAGYGHRPADFPPSLLCANGVAWRYA